MHKQLTIAFTIAAMLATSPAQSQQTTTTSAPAAAKASPAAAGLPAVTHLVYQFGYNTKAAASGGDTGTTTIDFVGMAADGGMTVKATDSWWNEPKSKQSFTCEVYADGGVTCADPPHALSPIQLAIVPLLGQNYFASLSGGPTASWTQNFDMKATFAPGKTAGFMGQVYTWNSSQTLTGKGSVSRNGASFTALSSVGTMKQQGGMNIVVDQKSDILFDPKLQVPAYVASNIMFVPSPSVSVNNQYAVELKLITPSP
jgi:hypothetical protein